MNYKVYLATEHWRLLRGAKVQISPRCERCNGREEIEVHHKLYRKSWFDAQLSDLQTLCHGCHLMEHAKEWERLEPPKKQSAFTLSKKVEVMKRLIARWERRGIAGKRLEKKRARLAAMIEKQKQVVMA